MHYTSILFRNDHSYIEMITIFAVNNIHVDGLTSSVTAASVGRSFVIFNTPTLDKIAAFRRRHFEMHEKFCIWFEFHRSFSSKDPIDNRWVLV